MFTSVDKFVRAAFVSTNNNTTNSHNGSEKYSYMSSNTNANMHTNHRLNGASANAANGRGAPANTADDNSDDDDDDDTNIPLMPSLPQLSIQKRNSILGGLNESSRRLLKTGSVAVNEAILKKRDSIRLARSGKSGMSLEQLVAFDTFSPNHNHNNTNHQNTNNHNNSTRSMKGGNKSAVQALNRQTSSRTTKILGLMERDGISIRDSAKAIQCLDDLIRVIDTLLMASLTKIHNELDDHVTYTRKPVKVWLSDLWDAKEEKERKENMVEGEDGDNIT